MAKRDLRRTFEEFESDDLSGLETTVPTDLSLSPDETSDFGHYGTAEDRKKKISKHLIERKQLLHDIQLLKIQVSQKDITIDSMKAEHMQKVEELEEKLSETLAQKQLLQARLESQLQVQQEDARRRTEQIQKELDTILKRQQHLELTNERLQEKAVDIRKTLKDLELTENQYRDLKLRNEEELALKDVVAIKLFEAVQPGKLENADLKRRCKGLSDELHQCKTAFERCMDEFDSEKRGHQDVDLKFQRLTLAYADVKGQVQHGDYKIENYDRVKRERDEFDAELTDLKKQHAYLEAAHQAAVKERDEHNVELASARQTISLLEKDKDFFSKQVSELHNKLLYSEEKLVQLNEQLERAKQSREDLYDKYVASRDQYKMDYETKLREELDQIRVRTNTEIDRLKTSTKEMYERENRSLREARDMALSEKDRAVASEKDTNGKHDQLLQDFRHMQMSTDTKNSDLRNEVKLKAFESERTQMVYEETVRNFKECQFENEKLQKKLEVLTKEYYGLQTGLEKQVSELEALVKEKNAKLETYEKLEQELDDVVMQAAEVEDEEEAERVMFSYGYGANVPTTAKRRLKQSVHLAKRVLQLERANTSLRSEVDREAVRRRQLSDELKNANSILDQSQQPYHYLVESIRVRDAQVTKQKEHISLLEEDVSRLEKERAGMTKSKNHMASDLERLLHQKEELSVMKQVVLNMSQRRPLEGSKAARSAASSTPRSPKTPKGSARLQPGQRTQKTAVHMPRNTFEPAERDENIHKPAPTSFTVHQSTRLHQKGSKSKYASIHQDCS